MVRMYVMATFKYLETAALSMTSIQGHTCALVAIPDERENVASLQRKRAYLQNIQRPILTQYAFLQNQAFMSVLPAKDGLATRYKS